ncbi:hypothetical protein [Enterococcus sp. HY326]|uniref:hypothetical protein n=1 Tax=Enterococcus sp. HY326 TaxID=2971265 RepID=UPI00223FE5C2|nr:hypothetical protein [Enterococcus sp. HY326]
MITLWQQLLLERKKRYSLTGIVLVLVAGFAWFQFQRNEFDPLRYGLDVATYPIYLVMPIVYFLAFENEEIFKAWGKARLRLLPISNLKFLLGNVLFGLFGFLGWSVVTYLAWYGVGSVSGIISLPSIDTMIYVFIMAVDLFLGVTMMVQSIGLVSKSITDFWPRRGKKAIRFLLIVLLFSVIVTLTSLLPGMPSIYRGTTEFGFDIGISTLNTNDGLIFIYDAVQVILMAIVSYFCLEKFYEGSQQA